MALDIRGLDCLRSGDPSNFLLRTRVWLARVNASSSVLTPSEYLRRATGMTDMNIKFGAYLQLGLSGEMRSAFLVIIALVATATYHAALAPPSAFSNGYNTSVNSTNFDNKTQNSKFTIVNTICFGMAMGTSFILALNPVVIAFLYGPLCLFLVAYAFLMHGVLNTGSIISAVLVAFCVPIFLVIPWWRILTNKESLTKRSDDYNLFEAKYLIFSSKYASRRSQEEGAVFAILPFFRN
ncbi:Ankyrin repeat-containing protein BDA1-like [Abeliophyllum distichum]|uniref:Ankyrin repeat-containing protein BDA1-like n=1 Tax=Abeliophyllum distichum TaxID=126358 RepID=A0ABD1TWR3_9LAMI